MSKRKNPDRLNGAEHRLRKIAEQHGLFILFEGSHRNRLWRVYDRTSGKVIGWYQPGNSHYHFRDREGTGLDPESALKLAGEMSAPVS